MSELWKNSDPEGQRPERLILVAVQVDGDPFCERSLDELEELVSTAGAESAGRMIQPRESIHPGTYVGKGKIEELQIMIRSLSATGICCDDELSSSQMQALEAALNVKILDRTMVILDIFAARALSAEGKIQVELAQLKYRSSRLTGFGASMSRLGGGIGTRGPGEKKLEVDRRLIRQRISHLKGELEEVRKHRQLLRDGRERKGRKTCALVGYTSAGKSSLLNVLTGSDVLTDAMLFATLDPTTRILKLEDGQEILLTDTVGFIRKLPHHLIEAFQSTLEEAKYADYIIHVADVSNPQLEVQMQVVYDTLQSLGVKDQPVITVLNKQDLLPERTVVKDLRADYCVPISAKTGEGLAELKHILSELLGRDQIYIERLYPYAQAGLVQKIRQGGVLLSEEYLDNGIKVTAYIKKEMYPFV